jgi:membrane-bound lytic murein transglycosylase B
MASLLRFSCIFLLTVLIAACTAKARAPQEKIPGLTDTQLETSLGGQTLSAAADSRHIWMQLSRKLEKDGLDARRTQLLFGSLQNPPSHLPMGTKVKELYSNAFLPKTTKPKTTSVETKLGIPGPWFKGVVTTANARLCKDFLKKYSYAFAMEEQRYGVPAEVIAALLFVETRLGTYIGKHNAFFMLASMSVIRRPESIPEYLDTLPGSHQKLVWIRQKMETKADWAYTELKALLNYCYSNALDPLSVKGSLYGAIGLCQFMPSNLARYGADGDNDGRINVFSAPDAIASAGRYLQKNGWKQGLNVAGQTKILRTYNAMDIYAHTILALAKTTKQLP